MALVAVALAAVAPVVRALMRIVAALQGLTLLLRSEVCDSF